MFKPISSFTDELTASLGPLNTDFLVGILKSLAQQGFTIGISSQDMLFVSRLFDRAYYLQSGKIVEVCEGQEMFDQCVAMKDFMG